MEIAAKNSTSQKYFPFTRRLQWLQGDGQAYIDTKLYGDQDTDIESDFTILDSSGKARVGGQQSYAYQAINICGGRPYSSSFRGDVWYQSRTIMNTGNFVVKNSKAGFYVNSVKEYDWGLGDFKFKTYSTMQVFTSYHSYTDKFTGYIHYFKVWQDEKLIMHLVPVRVGEVGCMYDEVSEQLFFNVGQGAFICGPDKGGNG